MARDREQVRLLLITLGLKSPLRTLGFAAQLVMVCLPFMDEASARMFGLFKGNNVHLSPEVRGRVFKDGEPLGGLSVYRELFYDEERYLDEVKTDTRGQFLFHEREIRSTAPGRPLTEARNVQVITTDYEDETYVLWHVAVDAIGRSATLERLLRKLECDLNTPEITHHFPNNEHPDFEHDIGSICRWPQEKQ